MPKHTLFYLLLVGFLLASNMLTTQSLFVIKAESPPQTKHFRLLAIEQMFDSTRMKSAQFLIEELLQYPNWDNSTNECVSHIHLLTMYNYSEVDEAVKPFWRGTPSTPLIQSEIRDFLGSPTPGEVVILYYCGHSIIVTWPPFTPPHSEFCGISPDQVRNWIATTNMSRACVNLILDTCYSGYWTELLPNVTVLAACGKEQMAWGGGWKDGPCGVFTVGLFQSFQNETDKDGDGWISVAESFPIAKNFTESHLPNQNPESHYGLVNGEIPLLQRDLNMPFPSWELSVVSMQIEPPNANPNSFVSINVTIMNSGNRNATFYYSLYCNQTEINMQELTLVSGKKATITFAWNTTGFYGMYLVSSKASICPGETDTTDNTMEERVSITILGDLNCDRTVNSLDATLFRGAFASKPGDTNWNPDADIDNNNFVNYLDAIILGAHFGETFS